MARLIVRGFNWAGYYYLLVSLRQPLHSFFLFPFFHSFFSTLLSRPLFLFCALLPWAICRSRFHEPRLGTPRSCTFRCRNNSGTQVFSPSSRAAIHRRSCRTLVIMRGEPCISHRGIIRKCFRQCPLCPAPPAAAPFFPRIFFSSHKARCFNPSSRFYYFLFRPTIRDYARTRA